MITLAGTFDYVTMLGLTLLFGSLGGFVGELLQTRSVAAEVARGGGGSDDTEVGAIQLPKLIGSRLFDLGVVASVLVGAGAALAALYFFPPAVNITVQASTGQATTSTQYDIVKLVALALLIGTAGPSFLTSMQSRVQAAVSENKAQAAKKISADQIDDVTAAAQTSVPKAVESALQSKASALRQVLQGAAQSAPADAARTTATASGQIDDLMSEIAKEAVADVQDELRQHADSAKKAIAAL